ncbi:MAG: DUF4397 domain-containing protein [Tepidiformaceae bacterium]
MISTRSFPRIAAASVLAILALVVVLSFSSPASAQTGNGRVRVMHASSDTPPVDIFVDGAKAVTALAFPNETGYVTLPAGAHNVKVFVSPSDGTGAAALEADLTIGAGKDYTVLAVGLVGDGSLALLPLEDNNGTPAAGNAHVRLVHASPDAPAVDVLVDGTTTKIFSNVAFKGVGTYTPVPAGTYNLDVNAAGTSTTALNVDGVALSARTVYTVVAVGRLSDGSLAVKPLLDAAAPATVSPPATGSGLAGDSSSTMTLLLGLGVAAAAVVAGGALLSRSRARI